MIRKNNRGFSLLELLTVVAIIGLMMGLLVPSFAGMRGSYGRKQAVSEVMNTLERARVAALQYGGNVHVIFARPSDSNLADDAMIVVGEPPLGSIDTKKIFITRWIKLPTGIHFRGSSGTLALGTLPTGFTSNTLPSIPGSTSFSSLTFNSTGQVQSPVSAALLLAIFEGTRTGDAEKAAGGSAQATKGLSDAGLYEVVRVSRFTGRPRAEVSTLEIK